MPRSRNYEREAVKEVGTIFEIDEMGRIWRIGRRCRGGLHGPAKRRRAETPHNSGYLRVGLRGPRFVLAHRLVYQYFFGNIPDGCDINHLNGNRADNRPENLTCVTPAEHYYQRQRMGQRSLAKLSIRDVQKIRVSANFGYSCYELAKRYGVHVSTIRRILKRNTWRHIGSLPLAKTRVKPYYVKNGVVHLKGIGPLKLPKVEAAV